MNLDSNYSDNFNQVNAHADLTSNTLHTNNNAQALSNSAVSWGAIFAGTLASAALTLILMILGIGFGISSVSVWSGQGVSAMTLGFSTIAWLALTQIIAYGLGGYLAGRLRTKWVSVHTDEVYFRDTAHGFLTWALASLLCATLLASAIGAIVGGAAKTSSAIVGGAASAAITGAASSIDLPADGSNSSGSNNASATSANPMHYLISTLFRKEVINNVVATTSQDSFNNTPLDADNTDNLVATDTNSFNGKANITNKMGQLTEVTSIFMSNINAETLPPSDVKYIAQLVSEQAGITQDDAEKRVTATFADMQQKKMNAITATKEATDKALSATAKAALWGFVFLLIGAFSASLAATWGGRSRDA